ncbi:protein terminal ear1-like [Salvia miltiorrhiza]|uniref:protein terminal ear1-like n=1 Tax=Salvia miltiorrhiza TaxID=226208 RepID=UPI0025ACB021|nr:protein terminal ear1-like [Salvia miltiorrhiza]
MTDPGFPLMPVRHLDPAAEEFFPNASPQIYYTYPPSPVYDSMVYPRPPHFPPYAIEPPPPLPVSVPPPSPTPSRTLLLSMVPASVSESTVRRELEVFGDVRSVQMERRREGLVTVHFYDVRASQAALVAIQDQHMQQQFRLGRHYEAVLASPMMAVAPPLPPQSAVGLISGRVVWAQFVTPVTSGLPDGNNQGTLVIFNLRPGFSASYLKSIFEEFGPVKELRETPHKRSQRFVELYDVRDSAKAMAALNATQILGKNAVIEFSRPGGQCRTFWNGPAPSRNLNPITAYSPRNSNRCSRPLPPTPRAGWRGNPSGSDGSKSSSSGSSLHGSLSNLCITGFEECSNNSNRRIKKTASRKGNGAPSSSAGDSKQSSHGGRPWKGGGAGRRGKEHDPRFLINEDTIVESNCRDSRTTVMIKNIPNKYSQKLLLNMLDNHCIHCNEQMTGGDDQPLSSYDFVYLPIDFINKCNVGYGFVNMTSPEATLRLYKAFHHQSWEVFNSRKICQVTYARLQGLDALREHFKNSKFPSDAEEYMPVVFSPPRDGRMLTDPVPITGCCTVESPLSSSTTSSKANQSEPHSDGLNGHHIYDGDDYDHDEGGHGGGCSYDDTDV